MSNHFTGLSLGPPLGDQRLDLCDLYVFGAPGDPSRTVLLLNANPNADAMHPDAVYRLNIDNDGDDLTDIAFSWVFAPPAADGSQTYSVFMATGAESRKPEAVGTRIVTDAAVSFDTKANVVVSGDYRVAAGSRSDAFYFDFDGVQNLFDTSGNRNFTVPHLGGDSPWTGVDSNSTANVFSMAVEVPTATLAPDPDLRVWGRCSVLRDGELVHADRAGHPSVSSFFNTDDTKEEYNASEPADDRARWTDQFVHLLGHTGGYSREEAIAALDEYGILPDVLRFDPARPAAYPNGRTFTEDVIDIRLAFLTRNEAPPTGLSPHADTLDHFPYLGDPHPATAS
ncbi:DUF4331 domain-containing protein [Streptomyces sp. NBC_01498]|uniref:DUF4331 family protein n=1 Tax=Streptomyces sp. NBC_01498 TaxID=2975870 RepID=UPI002E7BFBC6|nr:DUF4331 family protein [Streptomyces sp. NBC_01498]WTL28569.1 DUF4331 domain-containing protein [Streptomyces sp. NBC_01498]